MACATPAATPPAFPSCPCVWIGCTPKDPCISCAAASGWRCGGMGGPPPYPDLGVAIGFHP
eukprot:scaffold3228_cov384-Prasinococcus_capsulatus_cf.AAC.4